MIDKLDETREILDIKMDGARTADAHRARILQFNNELLRTFRTQENLWRSWRKSTSTKNTAKANPDYQPEQLTTHAVANIAGYMMTD